MLQNGHTAALPRRAAAAGRIGLPSSYRHTWPVVHVNCHHCATSPSRHRLTAPPAVAPSGWPTFGLLGRFPDGHQGLPTAPLSLRSSPAAPAAMHGLPNGVPDGPLASWTTPCGHPQPPTASPRPSVGHHCLWQPPGGLRWPACAHHTHRPPCGIRRPPATATTAPGLSRPPHALQVLEQCPRGHSTLGLPRSRPSTACCAMRHFF